VEAATEILRRRKIRGSLTEWARFHGFEPAPHQQLIIDEVERFLSPGDTDEVLLVAAPPGSAKSTYISFLTPSWFMANNPGASVLAATHSVEFAQRWGRKVRNDIALNGHVLGCVLSGDNSAVDRWSLTTGGEYYGVGAGVGISGFRAWLGVGDDFFGSREDAFSETIRKKRWEWYLDDFSARLRPRAKRILINTRWHEEDVAGRVLEQIKSGAVSGRLVEIKAQAEKGDVLGRKPGEWLWAGDPEYDYPSFLRQRKAETTSMMWQALYQQNPQPDEGTFFKRDWFKRYDDLPKVNLFGCSDFAVTDEGGDFTEHAVFGVGPDSTIYAVDWWRGQTDASVWVERWLDLVGKHKPLTWFAESGVIKRALESVVTKRMQERKTWQSIEWVASIHDKPTRARAFQALAANGKVAFPNTPWANDVLDQLIRFPAGKHDDAVDCCSLIGRAVAEAWPSVIIPVVKPGNPNDAYSRNRKSSGESWRTA
jgi:predicted phage terminase large subunit-like protein